MKRRGMFLFGAIFTGTVAVICGTAAFTIPKSHGLLWAAGLNLLLLGFNAYQYANNPHSKN